MTKDYPWGKGTPTWTYDSNTNDSDKSLTTPAGKIRKIIGVHVSLASTATVGNRNLRVLTTDGVNELTRAQSSSTQAASLTYQYILSTRLTNQTVSSAGIVIIAIPEVILPAGYVMRVYDSAAIDAAADDMLVAWHYVEYDA